MNLYYENQQTFFFTGTWTVNPLFDLATTTNPYPKSFSQIPTNKKLESLSGTVDKKPKKMKKVKVTWLNNRFNKYQRDSVIKKQRGTRNNYNKVKYLLRNSRFRELSGSTSPQYIFRNIKKQTNGYISKSVRFGLKPWSRNEILIRTTTEEGKSWKKNTVQYGYGIRGAQRKKIKGIRRQRILNSGKTNRNTSVDILPLRSEIVTSSLATTKVK